MEFMDVIIKLIASIIGVMLTLSLHSLKKWISSKISIEQQAEIKKSIVTFAKSAEQLLKEVDPTGEKRREYVQNHLTALGITVDDTIIGLIESAVFDINALNVISK